MEVIHKLPLPDILCHKIFIYACKSPLVDLNDGLFRYKITKSMYDKLTKSNNIVEDNGHISIISVFSFPTTLDLRRSMRFNIQNFELLSKLTVLYMGFTRVYGNIKGLGSLSNLTNLSISNTSITGDISSLSSLPNLTEFNLGTTNITGDIKSLISLPKLNKFWLTETSVYGDISSLRTHPNLTSINLYFTYAIGNMEVFHEYRRAHDLITCCVRI